MGVNLKYGTAGATGGGWSAAPGALQPSFVERWAFPKWNYQGRAPQTWKDKNKWYSLWSFGCRVGYGATSGADGASFRDLSLPDLYEPFSCDGEGTQSVRFIKGTTKNSSGTPISGVIVQGYVTSTDAYVGEVQSREDGSYDLGTQTLPGVAHYLVAYLPGSPDTAGTTVNTITSTNADGS